MHEYQYSFHKGRLDAFINLVGEGYPNHHLLRSTHPITRIEFKEYCRTIRDNQELTPENKATKAKIVSMGSAW